MPIRCAGAFFATGELHGAHFASDPLCCSPQDGKNPSKYSFHNQFHLISPKKDVGNDKRFNAG